MKNELFIIRSCYTRKFFSFQEFKGSAAAGGNMAHLIAIAQLIDSCSRISAANDRCCFGLSQSSRYSFGALSKNRILKHTHRSVPYDCLCLFCCSRIQFDRLRSDIHTHLVSRDLVGIYGLSLDLRIDRIRELAGDDGVDREKQLLAELLSLVHHLLAVIDLGLIQQRFSDFISLCFQESISHAAADDQRITFF